MFGKRKAERERVDALEAELTQLREQLERADRDAAGLRTHLTDVESTNQSLQALLAPFSQQGEELTDRVGELRDAVVRVDARVTGVATELANQITELSGELDALEEHTEENGAEPVTNGHAPDLDVDAIVIRLNDSVDEIVQEVLDEVDSTAERLAAEQARYQIQFRQDLADVADSLRRPQAS